MGRGPNGRIKQPRRKSEYRAGGYTAETALTTGEVAALIQLSPRCVSEWVDSGTIPGSYRLPGSVDRRIPAGSLIVALRKLGIPIPEALLDADPAALPGPFLACGLEPRELDQLGEEWEDTSAFEVGWAVAKMRPRGLVIGDREGLAVQKAMARKTREVRPMTAVVLVVSEGSTITGWDGPVVHRPCSNLREAVLLAVLGEGKDAT